MIAQRGQNNNNVNNNRNINLLRNKDMRSLHITSLRSLKSTFLLCFFDIHYVHLYFFLPLNFPLYCGYKTSYCLLCGILMRHKSNVMLFSLSLIIINSTHKGKHEHNKRQKKVVKRISVCIKYVHIYEFYICTYIQILFNVCGILK